MLPVLYSFRRCPYAIRARMALYYAAIRVELREVFLAEKPQSLLEASSKGTVPVILLPDGRVLDQSIDIMHWALAANDPDRWWQDALAVETDALIEENDFSFKAHLDHYKYWERFPARKQKHYRKQAEKFLLQLEHKLGRQQYLVADAMTFADVAIFPFVRQFAFVDKPWFDQAPYPNLQLWLQSLLASPLFLKVMSKFPVWREGDVPLVFPDSSFKPGHIHG